MHIRWWWGKSCDVAMESWTKCNHYGNVQESYNPLVRRNIIHNFPHTNSTTYAITPMLINKTRLFPLSLNNTRGKNIFEGLLSREGEYIHWGLIEGLFSREGEPISCAQVGWGEWETSYWNYCSIVFGKMWAVRDIVESSPCSFIALARGWILWWNI